MSVVEFCRSPRCGTSVAVSYRRRCTSCPHRRRTLGRADPSGVVGTILSLESPVSFAFVALVGAAYATYVRVPLDARLDKVDREIQSTRQDIGRLDTGLKIIASLVAALTVAVVMSMLLQDGTLKPRV